MSVPVYFEKNKGRTWWISIASVDGKQHLSEVVFSALVRFSSIRKVFELAYLER